MLDKMFYRTTTKRELDSCGGGYGYGWNDFAHFPSKIFRVAPKLWPACVAPLFCPACNPMTPSPARNCISVHSRLFSSDGFGPSDGPLHSGCLYAWKTASGELTAQPVTAFNIPLLVLISWKCFILFRPTAILPVCQHRLKSGIEQKQHLP